MEHKRQFLICKKKFSHTDFRCVELNNGFFLHHHIDLTISISDCKQNVLIGSAFKSELGAIADDLNDMDLDSWANFTANWSGRWILLIDDTLHIDPGGMLGCYYGKQKSETVISSSLALLKEKFLFEEEIDFKEIAYGNAMNWFPPPLTQFKGINKLLVGQRININKLMTEKINRNSNKFAHFTSDEIYKVLAEKLATIVKNVSDVYGEEIYLPLTGGFDSRTILAALLHNNATFSAFLFDHDNLSNADKNIPPILTKQFEFPFYFIKRSEPFDDKKYCQYIDNSSGQAADAGVLFYTYGQYEPLDLKSKSDKKIILRGGVWEVGRKIYSTALIKNSLSCEEDIMTNLKQCFPILKESNLHEKSIRLWVKHTQETNSILSFKDRFYLEQRVAGWLSAIEQASDLTGFDRIHPANCQDILDLLSLTATHPQPQIIRLLSPKLLATAFNPKSIKEVPKRLYKKLHQKVSRWF